MPLSPPGRAGFLSCALILQATTALAGEPAVQPWAAPLDSAVLSDVSAGSGLAAALPLSVPAQANHNASGVAATIELPRRPAAAWTPLGEIAQPAPHGFTGTSQTATSLALSITLDGATAFAHLQR